MKDPTAPKKVVTPEVPKPARGEFLWSMVMEDEHGHKFGEYFYQTATMPPEKVRKLIEQMTRSLLHTQKSSPFIEKP